MKFNMLGNANRTGPVRLSDAYSSLVGGASQGVAASQKALYNAYNSLNSRVGNIQFISGDYSRAGLLQAFPNQGLTPIIHMGRLTDGPHTTSVGMTLFAKNDYSTYGSMIRFSDGQTPTYCAYTNGTWSGWRAFFDTANPLYTTREVKVYGDGGNQTGLVYRYVALPVVSGYSPVGTLGWRCSGAAQFGINMFDCFIDIATNRAALNYKGSIKSTTAFASIFILYIRNS